MKRTNHTNIKYKIGCSSADFFRFANPMLDVVYGDEKKDKLYILIFLNDSLSGKFNILICAIFLLLPATALFLEQGRCAHNLRLQNRMKCQAPLQRQLA